MGNLSVTTLFITLIVLITFITFFSLSEISMMSINHYRLRHAVRKKVKRAIRVHELLMRTDRLLSTILIGNTLATIFASAISTILSVRLFGDKGLATAASAVVLTLFILIFAEMAPKNLAAMYPEHTAYLISLPLKILQTILSPIVFLSNYVANQFLWLFGVDATKKKSDALSSEELRTVVHEAGHMIPSEHRKMLVNILDLEKVTVEDIMVPRNEVLGIDLNQPWDIVLEQIETSQHTRLPLFRESIDKIEGVIHLRQVATYLVQDELDEKKILELAEKPYYILESVTLYSQLLNFRKAKQRTGLVVDEYGEMQGLVTLEDILEEIVGEFTTDKADISRDISPQEDGSIVVDGTITLRELNRDLKWALPTTGPKTLSGLIIEHLEFIPPAGTCIKIKTYFMEVLQVQNNRVKAVRMWKA